MATTALEAPYFPRRGGAHALKKENKRPAPPTFSDKVGSNKPPSPSLPYAC